MGHSGPMLVFFCLCWQLWCESWSCWMADCPSLRKPPQPYFWQFTGSPKYLGPWLRFCELIKMHGWWSPGTCASTFVCFHCHLQYANAGFSLHKVSPGLTKTNFISNVMVWSPRLMLSFTRNTIRRDKILQCAQSINLLGFLCLLHQELKWCVQVS